MNLNNTTFNLTEEAFLLSSLTEVVKVWARGSGQASFDLQVDAGVAELKLAFKLGHPAEQHTTPAPPPTHFPYQQEHHHHGRTQRRHKGPVRRERDRERARLYQSRPEPTANKEQPKIVLPFSGNLLPILPKDDTSPPEAAQTASQSIKAVVPAVTPPPAASHRPAAAGPQKQIPPNKESPQVADSVKKKLFVNDPPAPLQQLSPAPRHQLPPDPGQSIEQKKYKMKEEDLWTKLFTL